MVMLGEKDKEVEVPVGGEVLAGNKIGKVESLYGEKVNVRMLTDNSLETLDKKDLKVPTEEQKKKYYSDRTRKEIEDEIARLQKLLDQKTPLTDRQLKEKEEREKIAKNRELEDQEAEIKLKNATAVRVAEEEREKKVAERIEQDRKDQIAALERLGNPTAKPVPASN